MRPYTNTLWGHILILAKNFLGNFSCCIFCDRIIILQGCTCRFLKLLTMLFLVGSFEGGWNLPQGGTFLSLSSFSVHSTPASCDISLWMLNCLWNIFVHTGIMLALYDQSFGCIRKYQAIVVATQKDCFILVLAPLLLILHTSSRIIRLWNWIFARS